MRAEGTADEIYERLMDAVGSIRKDIQADEGKLKELHAMRQADMAHQAAWAQCQKGLERAHEIIRRLLELARQCKALGPLVKVELVQEETALLSYVKDETT